MGTFVAMRQASVFLIVQSRALPTMQPRELSNFHKCQDELHFTSFRGKLMYHKLIANTTAKLPFLTIFSGRY